jgi:hypothetical protein
MLFRGNAPVPLLPKAIDTLLMLVENAGTVVDKREILKQVWKHAFVEEGSLTRTISLLREALGRTRSAWVVNAMVRPRTAVVPPATTTYWKPSAIQTISKMRSCENGRATILTRRPFRSMTSTGDSHPCSAAGPRIKDA